MSLLAEGYPEVTGAAHTDPTMFLFLSNRIGVKTSGVCERISVPAVDGGQDDSPLVQAVREAMGHARNRGVDNPIVVGAIPFDTSQASCLLIPEHYEFVRKEDCQMPTDGGPLLSIRHASSEPEEEEFKTAVTKAITAFKQGKLEKAVLSRVQSIDLNTEVNPDIVQGRLMAQNPGAYHFRLPLPDGSTLIGASPELLLRKEGDYLYSNPLAGSAKRQRDAGKDRDSAFTLLNSDKDRYEHKLVIDVMRQQLQPVCSSLHIPDFPALINTPTMWHLSTDIQGKVSDPDMTALQLACLLHPTPAMCGAPTDSAAKLIASLEPHSRGVFSGMVGWMDSNGNGEWALVIRSGLIRGQRIQLFAGAGVVADSCPESEWAETTAKMETMLNAFGLIKGSEI